MSTNNSADELTNAIAEFATTLKSRLEQRPGAAKGAQRLDLRHRDFKQHQGYTTLRDPRHPRWPADGATTIDRDTAEGWIDSHYARRILRDLRPELFPEPSGPTSVADAMDQYLAWLARAKGQGHNTTRNRRSNVEVHIKPALGTLPFTAETLDRKRIRTFLEGLEVAVSKYGPIKRAAAKRGTVDAVRDTLRAAWVFHYPDIAPPFGAMKLHIDDGRAKAVEAIKAGEVGVGAKEVSYTPEQVTRLLTAAMWYDLHAIEHVPNVIVTTVPNSAAAMALQIANAMRISELVYWRWCHVYPDEGVIWVPGTKTTSAARWAPLQRSALPWLRLAKATLVRRGVRPTPKSFVVHSRWHPAPNAPAGRNTYEGRFALIELLAGLKIPQKASHPFRSTHITWAETSGKISHEQIQQYIGHAGPFGDVTTRYVDRRQPFIPRSHRAYIDLPTPQEIIVSSKSFVPSISLDEARQTARRAARPE